jgi:hypothetical protein
LYEYRCAAGHVSEELRRYVARDRAAVCQTCGARAKRTPPLPHGQPDGIYSYAPNIGDPSEYERRHEDARERSERLK